MPSHWFILIGFGFSQQQSELIFLSWNNSAPFVPVFYCLIPFILFYCQSFVSLGLQVISNPVGCYNEAFIPQLPRFPCPFGQEPALAVWHRFNPLAARAAACPGAAASHRGLGVVRAGPAAWLGAHLSYEHPAMASGRSLLHEHGGAPGTLFYPTAETEFCLSLPREVVQSVLLGSLWNGVFPAQWEQSCVKGMGQLSWTI